MGRIETNNRWLFLLYLCDDFELKDSETHNVEQLHDKIDTLAENIKQLEGLKKLRCPIDVVYQFDSFLDVSLDEFVPPADISRREFNAPDQHCIRRYLSWNGGDSPHSKSYRWDVIRHASYKTIDTGKTQTLKEFFEWARNPIEEAAGIVVVFAGLGVGDKEAIVGGVEEDYGQTFSICDDKSASDALNPIEVQDALELLVNEFRDGEPIDVLGFDMSSMQFVEVAYQFMGLARTLVASQNSGFDPFWPYANLVKNSAKLISRNQDSGRFIGPLETGPMFVETIGQRLENSLSLGKRQTSEVKPIISAVDVSQLDVLARSMDTLFLNLLQALGDEAIWNVRDLTFLELRNNHKKNVDMGRQHKGLIAFDLRLMLASLRDNLNKICTAEDVLEQWFASQLRELHDDLAMPQEKKNWMRQRDENNEFLRDKIVRFIRDRTQGAEDEAQENTGGNSRLWRLLKLLTFDENFKVYCPPLDEYESRGETGDHQPPYYIGKEKYLFDCEDPDANAFIHQLKERFDRLTYTQLQRSALTAKHLNQIANDVITLLQPPPQDPTSSLAGFRSIPKAEFDESGNRNNCIVAQYSYRNFDDKTATKDDNSETQQCSNDYCGLLIYRPEHLDRLSESQYLDFLFHRRVHWVSVLAAINLIRKHPGQLWNVVSSLISTCTGAGRDELLQRLAGPTSVANRFGKQFQALQNPLTFTLTITENRKADSEPASDSQVQQNESVSNTKSQAPAESDALTYNLRLETNRQDAFVDVGTSTLNRRRAKQSLQRLENIIAPKNSMLCKVETLEDFARDLGEDVFQGIDLHIRRDETDLIPHLQLQLPIELMGLPWEVMNEGRISVDGRPSKMLCERFAISRQALIDSGLATSPRSRTSSKIRVLIVGDPLLSEFTAREYGARQLDGAVDEARDVEQLFRQLARDLPGTLQLEESDIQVSTKITGNDVRKLLRDGKYDIVHFAGHAIHNEEFVSQSGWLLSDGILWAQEISNTLKNCQSPPWLVYANACESGMSSPRYQRDRTNVYGLGTAFTNNGVTAYLGPLWQIGDFVAGQMATDFYRCLLLERATIGESLFIAKRNARQRLEGAVGGDLSWASMIAYGDSRMKLLDSTGADVPNKEARRTDNRGSGEPPSQKRSEYEMRLRRLSKFSATGQPIQPMQASVRSTCSAAVQNSFLQQIDTGELSTRPVREQEFALELRQINGVCFWQYMKHDDDEFQGLPDSPLKRNLETNQRLQYRLGIRSGHSLQEDSRLVFHLRVPMSTARNLGQLLADIDTQSVDSRGLVSVNRNSETEKIDSRSVRVLSRQLTQRSGQKVLVLVHDAISSTKSMVELLGEEFIKTAQRHYAAILGFNHWSLRFSVLENCGELAAELSSLFPKYDDNGRKIKLQNVIDIIGAGRGGLIARALVERKKSDTGSNWNQLVRAVAMVGTPNFGSNPCQQKNHHDENTSTPIGLGQVAERLANCLHVDRAQTGKKNKKAYINLSSILAISSVFKSLEPNGFSGNDRQRLLTEESLQCGLRPPEGVKYLAVAAAYAPGAVVSAVKIIQECCDDINWFAQPNDLIVDCAEVWSKPSVAGERNFWRNIPSLFIEPVTSALYSGHDVKDGRLNAPPAAERVYQNGVHHTNLLGNSHCLRFLQQHLLGIGSDQDR